MDERLPVLVGLGELVRRLGEGDETDREPTAMMAEAARAAAADAGAGDALLRKLEIVAAAPSVAGADGDPARRVADLLDVDARTMRSSRQGGNGPQLMVSELAGRIQAGRLDAALVCGAEALFTVARAMNAGRPLPWAQGDPDSVPDEVLEGEAPPATDAELDVGVIAPIMAYPLIENAIRAAAGVSAAEQLERVARLWASFSRVAAGQPCAWSREPRGPDELRTPSASNRPVSLPYLKLMNANIQTDQAAALILCSAGTAAGLGIPRDRWVFPLAGAQATDEWFLSERRELHRSPAIAACGRALFEHAGCGPDDIAHIDLYGCFPSAVQLAAGELGFPLDDPARPLTCTGGLTFFGGPGNNYATHGIAAVARRLREGPEGSIGLATALGWYATKHALALYGDLPPRRGFASLTPEPAAVAPRTVAEPGEHAATAETCTVIYKRDGSASYGILFALLDDGRRVLGRTRDPEVMAAMPEDGFLGSAVRLGPDRNFRPSNSAPPAGSSGA
jgi:acetyl-CoA C-acetyltransferase